MKSLSPLAFASTPNFLLWFSPAVVKAWVAFNIGGQEDDNDDEERDRRGWSPSDAEIRATGLHFTRRKKTDTSRWHSSLREPNSLIFSLIYLLTYSFECLFIYFCLHITMHMKSIGHGRLDRTDLRTLKFEF